MNKPLNVAIGSILVSVLVLGLKYLAYWLTGSIALYSDALESIVNVVTAVVALWAVRMSAKPADANHPFGHHKIEYFSAVLEGVMIIIAALLIVREAYDGFLHPRQLAVVPEGLLVNGLASIVNATWAWVLIVRGRRMRSPALVADGRHLLTDVISSVGILIGLVLALVMKWEFLDPALALIVAATILWSGWGVLKESAGGLLDEAVPKATLNAIRRTIADHAAGALEAHDVRTRHAGRVTFIEFHLVVPGQMTVSEAHRICDRLEAALRAEDEDRRITIHVEPEEKAKHSGIVVV
ncbi:cation diffusion facilitator family transporter [Bradyrhizobium neotropicale]|uniref:cation diffusion facilitator family transporter n=1 Tax=Bradyrhizobium neotropicale TaxID=1497615 RepID=UPI001AD75A67|nr:cation diffusion facilitator family transporter [Bradyrhizobium neotropicale]MBO4226764.1 cation diffusion facilitator family transporter [Bradyrhizobium neotropicale]